MVFIIIMKLTMNNPLFFLCCSTFIICIINRLWGLLYMAVHWNNWFYLCFIYYFSEHREQWRAIYIKWVISGQRKMYSWVFDKSQQIPECCVCVCVLCTPFTFFFLLSSFALLHIKCVLTRSESKDKTPIPIKQR